MKKLLAILLTLCMIFSMMPITASAESAVVASGTCGDNLTWVLDEEGMLTISGEGAMKDYMHPNYVPWASYRSKIIRAWVQEGVTSLGDYAFYNLTNMFDITLPDSLERIGAVALANTALDYVYIPSGVAELGGEVFSGCSALTYISVSKENAAYSSDDKGVLFNKDQTALIRIPAAFAGAYVIPGTVEVVEEKAANNCRLLTEVTIPGSVKELRRHAFAVCEVLETVHLSEGLEFIANEAFMNCHALKGTMTIPSTVTRMGSAFFNCPEVTAWKFLGDMPVFEDYTFGGIDVTVYYPAGNETWTEEKIEAIKGLSTFVPYDSMEDAASGTWGENINWTLTQDGTLIISGEGEVQSAWTEEYTWYPYAAQIRKVIFEEGVTNVPQTAFTYYYPNLVSVELKSVEVIGNSAFTQCYALTDVILPDTLKEIETSAFCMTGLTSVNIPQGVTFIGSSAFYETKLTEIVLPEGLLELGDGVFFFCHELKSAVLPDSVTTIGMHLFAYCTALETANIPANLTTMPEAMFDGCTSLKSIEIPDGIENMYMGNFQGSGLVSVTIPASVKIMGSPFSYCLDLKEITFLGDAPEIMGYCFQDVVATAYYPAGNETWTEEVMQNYGGTITWVPYGEVEKDYSFSWYSGTTSLNGTIDLNIYAVIGEDLLNAPDAFVRFSYRDKIVDVPMSEALHAPTAEHPNLYRFSCPMYAKEVVEDVTVRMMLGDRVLSDPAKGEALEYGIVDYCMNRIQKSTNPTQVAMCKALLNYASAAQLALNYKTDNLANAGLSDEDKLLPEDIDVSSFKSSLTGSETGIKADSATLMYESEVSVRVYFALEEGYDISDFTFTIDGEVVAPQQNDYGWFVETAGIPAKHMDQMFTFCVGGITVKYGPMSYVNNKLSASNANTANLAKALYVYYQAAEALLG